MALLSMMPSPRRWVALLSLSLAPALALTKPAATTTKAAAADYYVRNLPGLPTDGPEVKMHAG
jgi:carboxypeptidase D